jgi:ribosomal protein S18 acetylase RimI-like enzyme
MPDALADSGTQLASAIETDRRYFELGARLERLPGADLAWMPGLASAPAGAVIQRVDPETVLTEGSSWLFRTERALSDLGARTSRIYLDESHDASDHLFRDAGYSKREELIFAHSLGAPKPGLRIVRVESDLDWDRKLELQQSMPTPPDGHSTSALDWIELERRKCDAGMEMYLAEWDGEPVGAIGAMKGDGLLRLKNIAVHPAHRRKGVGLRMLGHLGISARERGISEQCVFAVRGEIGELLYRAAGMRVVGSVIEWSKPLGEPNR